MLGRSAPRPAGGDSGGGAAGGAFERLKHATLVADRRDIVAEIKVRFCGMACNSCLFAGGTVAGPAFSRKLFVAGGQS